MLDRYGAIIRADTRNRKLALVFTADEFADGAGTIAQTLREQGIKGAFFLTGRFMENKSNQLFVQSLIREGHYVGVHSDQHLLYCDWKNRDSLLVSKREFEADLRDAYRKLENFGIEKSAATVFLPPYEWYNEEIVNWTGKLGLKLVNYTPGTLSAADYTFPDMGNRYRDNATIFNSITTFERDSKYGLNGFFLLLHLGTDARRIDKFYVQLPALIDTLKKRGYDFERIDKLID